VQAEGSARTLRHFLFPPSLNALNEGEARLNAFNGKAASGSREHGAERRERGGKFSRRGAVARRGEKKAADRRLQASDEIEIENRNRLTRGRNFGQDDRIDRMGRAGEVQA